MTDQLAQGIAADYAAGARTFLALRRVDGSGGRVWIRGAAIVSVAAHPDGGSALRLAGIDRLLLVGDDPADVLAWLDERAADEAAAKP